MTDSTKGHPGRPKQGSGGIKSAWELALEKADRLGKLSPEELKRQREEERAAAGRSLAQRYLSGLPLRDLLLALEKYQAEEREAVRTSLLPALLEAVELGNPERATAAVEGIAGLAKGAGVQQLTSRVRALLDEYAQALAKGWEESRAQVEQELRQALEREGIGGAAVEPNIQRAEARESIAGSVRPQYVKRLDPLKAELAQAIAVAQAS
ncbi:MAG: hypothetical protein AB1603_02980 [Chloroflexota bacterium]